MIQYGGAGQSQGQKWCGVVGMVWSHVEVQHKVRGVGGSGLAEVVQNGACGARPHLRMSAAWLRLWHLSRYTAVLDAQLANRRGKEGVVELPVPVFEPLT